MCAGRMCRVDLQPRTKKRIMRDSRVCRGEEQQEQGGQQKHNSAKTRKRALTFLVAVVADNFCCANSSLKPAMRLAEAAWYGVDDNEDDADEILA